MDKNHWFLLLFWILYCLIHSLLAAVKVKLFLKTLSGNCFRYYRLTYTIVAIITLLLVLYFQFSFTSPVIFTTPFAKYILLMIFLLPGSAVMLLTILKYITSIHTFHANNPNSPGKLHQKGIHKYVRHPLYSGTLLVIWGLFFAYPMLNNLIAILIITAYVLIGARMEEKKLLLEFGQTYRLYMAKVPMFVPHLRKKR